MARLVHLNGPPGIGKSTLSALLTDRHPGMLNLDVDALHRLVGGWRDVLLDDRDAAVARFHRRARASDDPWVRHHHRLIEQRGGTTVLTVLHDRLLELVRLRPEAVVVPSTAGAVEETYELVTDALRGR